jgi:hypothetical protein
MAAVNYAGNRPEVGRVVEEAGNAKADTDTQLNSFAEEVIYEGE